MRIAKDGKPFDIDYVKHDARPDEIEVIQFLRSDGTRRRMLANVGAEVARKAVDMILSAEELSTDEIVVYARFINEDKEKEISGICQNGPGPREPVSVLKELIEKKFKQRSEE